MIKARVTIPTSDTNTQGHEVAETPRPKRLWLQDPTLLIIGFTGIHLLFLAALLPTMVSGGTLGDLPLYRYWADQALVKGFWAGIHEPWVYPIGALLPIVGADVFGQAYYLFFWFAFTAALNLCAVWMLTGGFQKRATFPAAWWFLLLNVLLSPVALLRLEGITSPLVIIGLIYLATRPVVASMVLTLATWIKVWPAAVMLAVVTVSRQRVLVVITGAATSAFIVLAGLLAGAGKNILSFVSMQGDRGLQLEAPITTPWVWLASLKLFDSKIYYNFDLKTVEVSGPGSATVSDLMNPIMFAVMAGILVLVLLATKANPGSFQLLCLAAFAFTCAFVVFNKVGSPQYMLWLVPIVAVGMVGHIPEWKTAVWMLAIIGALTTVIFPLFYSQLMNGDLILVIILSVRNILLVLLFAWAIKQLWRLRLADHTSVPA